MVNAVDHIGFQSRLGPDRLAMVDLARDLRWSFAKLDRDVAACASVLKARGIATGDRVATLARNRAELIILHHACARIGAIYVPLNWRLSGRELAALVADADPALLLGDECLVAAGLDGEPLDALLPVIAAASPMTERPIDPDLPSLILYTSGTSGAPKGAMLTERAIAATARNTSLLCQVARTDAILCDSPMFHVIGLVTSIRPFLMQGSALLISDGFVPARTLARLEDKTLGITHYFCVPQMAAALRAEPTFDPRRLDGMKAIFTGGAPHPRIAIQRWLDDGIAIVDGYGMSEAGTVFGMPIDRALIAARAGSAGIAAPGIETRIVDDVDAPVLPGMAGELMLRGENVVAGYWRRPEADAATFTRDGWLRTGDIVMADDAGYHWIVDRKKDMFISGGENVYPAEVEAAVLRHPAVVECAVVGVPDATWGEVGHLFAVLKPETACGSGDLLRHVEELIARYKLPKRITFLEILPRNGAGKVLKPHFRRIAADDIAPVAAW